MIRVKKDKLTINSFIFIIFLFASMDLFQIKGLTFFFCFCVVLVFYVILKQKKVYFIKDYLLNAIYIEIFISGILSQLSNMPISYKKTAIIMPVLSFSVYLVAAVVNSELKKNKTILECFLKAIKIVCYSQFVYVLIQYVFFHFFSIDINKVIFVDVLKLVENASFIRDWVWYPSGFTYHSAIIAPLMVVGFLFFNDPLLRFLIIIDSLICGSSTAIIGVALCFLFLFLSFVSHKRVLFDRPMAFFIGIGIIFILILSTSTNLMSFLTGKIVHLFQRLLGSSKDASTSAHFSYYSMYPHVVSNSSFISTLFGFGYGCSGYSFSVLYNRTELGNWAVESDVMDILYSRGIVGFVLFYSFLIRNCINGRKIDMRYLFISIVLIIQGFGYNIQWDYIFLIEILIFMCIKKNINIFKIAEDVRVFNRGIIRE